MARIIQQGTLTTPNYGMSYNTAKPSNYRVTRDLTQAWKEFLRADERLRNERNNLIARINQQYDKIEITTQKLADPNTRANQKHIHTANLNRMNAAMQKYIDRIRDIDDDLNYIKSAAIQTGNIQKAIDWAKTKAGSQFSLTSNVSNSQWGGMIGKTPTQHTSRKVAPSTRLSKSKSSRPKRVANQLLTNAAKARAGFVAQLQAATLTPPAPAPTLPFAGTTVTAAKPPKLKVVNSTASSGGSQMLNLGNLGQGGAPMITGAVSQMNTMPPLYTPPQISRSDMLTKVYSSQSIRSMNLQTADEMYAQIMHDLGNRDWSNKYAPEQLARWKTLADKHYNDWQQAESLYYAAKTPEDAFLAEQQMRAATQRLARDLEQTNRRKEGMKSSVEKKRRIRASNISRSNRLYKFGKNLVGPNAFMTNVRHALNASPDFTTAEKGSLLTNLLTEADLYRRGRISNLPQTRAINKQIQDAANRTARAGMAHQYHVDDSRVWTLLGNQDAYNNAINALGHLQARAFGDPFRIDSEQYNQFKKALDEGLALAKQGGDYSMLKNRAQNIFNQYQNAGKYDKRLYHEKLLQDVEDARNKNAFVPLFGMDRKVDPMDQAAVARELNVLQRAAKLSGQQARMKDAIGALRNLNTSLDPLDEETHSMRRTMMGQILHVGRDIERGMTSQNYLDLAFQTAGGPNDKGERVGMNMLRRQAMLREAQTSRWVQQKQMFSLATANLFRPHMFDWRMDDNGEMRFVRNKRSWRQAFARKGEDFRTWWSQLTGMVAQNPKEMFINPLVTAFKAGVVISAIAGAMATGATIGLTKAAVGFGKAQSVQRTQLRNMYNLAIPTSWRGGRSYAQFEEQAFKDARLMRTDAYTLQDNTLRLAMAVQGARYTGGPNKGGLIVHSLEEVERMNRVMALMGRLSGISDPDLAAFMIQIQQAIGKGKADIMDIKPMENRSPYMASLFATKVLGLSGSSEMFKLMDEGRGDRTKGITAERILTGMMSEKTESELIDMLRQSARTWDEVFTVMGSDFKKAMLSFTEEFEQGAGGRIGSQLLGISKWIAENDLNDIGTLGDNLAELLPDVGELSGLLQKGTHWLGELLDVGGRLTQGLTNFIPLLVLLGKVVIAATAAFSLIFGIVPAIVRWMKGDNPNEPGTLWSAFTTLVGPEGASMFQSLDKLGALSQEGLLTLGEFSTDIGEMLESFQFGRENIENALGGTPEIQGPVAKIAENTEELKKQGAKMQSVQLELLKQISGKAVINRVTRVAPNVVANVGTIKSGVEYDQFMRDLTRSVHLATANVAY